MKKHVVFLRRMMRKIKVNRKYKDQLFRIIFREKEDLLELYNAVNDSAYTEPDELTITTLEDVIFLGMKNDLSFLIGSELNLYEHQSTWNENMPLRGLFYFSDMLRGFIEKNDLNLYKEKRISLPVPRYIVFYNGEDTHPDEVELRLSDAFPEKIRNRTSLECKVTVLNINKGHNAKLMAKSKRLSDYSYFVQAVRDNMVYGYRTEEAVAKAVDECIEKDILADILRKNRAEVVDLFMTTYDAKMHKRAIEEEAREKGQAEGRAKGIAEGRAEGRAEGIAEGRAEGIAEGRTKGIAEGRSEERLNGCRVLVELCSEAGYTREKTVYKLMEKYAIMQTEAEQIVEVNWKADNQ